MTDLSYGPFISRKQAQAQGLKHYFTGKSCKHGHTDIRYCANGHCFVCLGVVSKEQSKEQWNRHKEKRNSARRVENLTFIEHEKRKRQDHQRYVRQISTREGLEKVRAASARSRRKHQNSEKGRATTAAYRKISPSYRVQHALRSRLQSLLISRTTRFNRLVGCTGPELVSYLEAQFSSDMNWDNYGLHGWHVDHIRPIASFDNPEDPECWHYTNLQPLWAAENLAKSDKWVPVAV